MPARIRAHSSGEAKKCKYTNGKCGAGMVGRWIAPSQLPNAEQSLECRLGPKDGSGRHPDLYLSRLARLARLVTGRGDTVQYWFVC